MIAFTGQESHIKEVAKNNAINTTIPAIKMRIVHPHEAPFFAPLIIASFSLPLFEKINPSNNPVNVSTKMNINPAGIKTKSNNVLLILLISKRFPNDLYRP